MSGPLFPSNFARIWVRGQFIDLAGNAKTGAVVLTPSPATQYQTTYTCPGNCTAVAVYFQVPGLVPSAVVDINLDKATLIKV